VASTSGGRGCPTKRPTSAFVGRNVRKTDAKAGKPVQCCAPLGDPALTEDEANELETVFKALATAIA
jgi:hypothetical protein